MPIRVPQILAQTAPELGSAPHADPVALGHFEVAPYRGLADVATIMQQAADQYYKIREALTKEEMRLDVEDKLTQVRDKLAQEDVALRQEGVDPDQLAEQFRQRGTRAIGDVAKELRYPQSAPRFQTEANKALGHEVIRQRYEGLNLKYAHIAVLAGVANQEDANTAIVAASPEARDAALGRLADRIGRLTATGVWSQDKATSETEGFLAQIELGRVRKDYQDYPDRRPDVIARLLAAASPHVKAEAQFALAHTLTNEQEARERRDEDKAEKEAKKATTLAVADLWRQAETKQKADGTPLTRDDIHDASRRLGLPRQDIEALTDELAKEAKDQRPSDPVTLARVSADVHGMRPTISEQEIKAEHAAGRLNTKDRNALLEKRTTRMTHLAEYGQTQLMQQHGAAVQRFKASFGIPDIVSDAINPERLLAFDGALRELDARSSAFPGGREAPLSIVQDIIDRWKPLVADQSTLDLEATMAVTRFKTMADLDTARVARALSPRPMTEAEYRQERDLTLAHIRALKAQADAEIKALQQKQQGGKAAKPGTFSKGTALPAVK